MYAGNSYTMDYYLAFLNPYLTSDTDGAAMGALVADAVIAKLTILAGDADDGNGRDTATFKYAGALQTGLTDSKCTGWGTDAADYATCSADSTGNWNMNGTYDATND